LGWGAVSEAGRGETFDHLFNIRITPSPFISFNLFLRYSIYTKSAQTLSELLMNYCRLNTPMNRPPRSRNRALPTSSSPPVLLHFSFLLPP
jgi:hypothetical protein